MHCSQINFSQRVRRDMTASIPSCLDQLIVPPWIAFWPRAKQTEGTVFTITPIYMRDILRGSPTTVPTCLRRPFRLSTPQTKSNFYLDWQVDHIDHLIKIETSRPTDYFSSERFGVHLTPQPMLRRDDGIWILFQSFLVTSALHCNYCRVLYNNEDIAPSKRSWQQF